MQEYFSQSDSMAARIGSEVNSVIEVISRRFVADNPPTPVTYYIRSQDSFPIAADYMDQIRLDAVFDDLELESIVYAWATLTVPTAEEFLFRFGAYGPVRIFVNGEYAFQTDHVQERLGEIFQLKLSLKQGVNSLLFQCTNTPLGCGFQIGSRSFKGRRIQFFAPTKERTGYSGFIYSKPLKHPLAKLPEIEASEAETGLQWLPAAVWSKQEQCITPLQRIFGELGSRKVLQATAINISAADDYLISGHSIGDSTLYLDSVKIADVTGNFAISCSMTGGAHILSVMGQEIEIAVMTGDGNIIAFEIPVRMFDAHDCKWLYLGPIDEADELNIEAALELKKPQQVDGKMQFWRIDRPGSMIRPFNEGTLYGEWNYPLGVTLYGLVQTARTLTDHRLLAYVRGHMQKCVDYYDYCMWDKEHYGAAPFHNQLTTVDSLDDCGSFASALLEVMKDQEITEGRKVAEIIADYIMESQQRLADGVFYRNHSYMPVMNETMWADDMYMSIPFLCRYYQLSKDETYLNEAVRQALGFYKYLYMPEEQIMSHIYDTRHQVQTKVPWGRGNGWVLFSLAELLEVIPAKHRGRTEILTIYQTLCGGYLKLQDKSGMWHQVLTFADSYPETSCTAMFVYSFAKGVRNGWLEESARYLESARRGWQALCNIAVDYRGNVYGVCRGSGYSFSKDYYANELGWIMNDTHGVGIVLLAGIEVQQLN